MKKIVPVFLAGILLLGGCSSQGQNIPEKEVAVDAQAAKPVFLMAGKIEANEKSDVTTKISAKVAEIMVDIGSKVNKGDAVIKLDTKDLEAQVQQAEAGVNTAQANLDKVKSGARPEEKAKAKSALDSAKQNYENAKKSYERINKLFQDGAVSKQQLETAEGQLTSTKAQYESANEQMNIINSGETKDTINVLEAQVKQAKAALNIAQTQLNNGVILSPVSGVVSDKNIDIGEMASPGMSLLSIVNTDSLIVNAYLPAGLVDKVKNGQKVIVKVSEIQGKLFEGEIAVIDPVIDDEGKNILVKVVLKDDDPALKPGMFAEIGLNM